MPTSSAIAVIIDADKELASQQARWPDIAELFQPARDALATKLKEAKLAELRQRKAAIDAEEAALLSGAAVEPEPEPEPVKQYCDMDPHERAACNVQRTIASIHRQNAKKKQADEKRKAEEAEAERIRQIQICERRQAMRAA
jgi:hypothetical protein